MMDKLDGKSMDLNKENIEKLKELFPSIVSDGKIDFDMLKTILGEEVDSSNEKYSFTWNGKYKTIKLAQTPSTGTLIPCKEKSVNWDTTENIYIEGDNLEVLKLLQKTYFSKIKTIYIDPPYNTGNDFVYKDDFKNSIENYKEITNQVNRANPESNGRYHTDWLNMMYSRLLLAKNLLKSDGVLLVSIDDNELFNLKKICDEIFGENSFICNFVWKSKSGGANDAKNIATDTEYILCYVKNPNSLKVNFDKEAEVTTSYNYEDENGKYSLDRLDKQSLGYLESLDFPIFGPDGLTYQVIHKDINHKQARWRWGKDTVKERYNELVFKYPYVYTKNYQKEGILPRNLLVEERFGRSRTGKTEVRDLFEGNVYFDFPKPTKLIKFLINIFSNKDDIVVDFFSGSATTADAVMQLNAEDGGNRKYILVQLPEIFNENTNAYKDGYKTICEIGEKRIRSAGKKIKEENPLTTSELDTGFKIFKLDSTNIRPWDSSIKLDESNIFNYYQTIKENRKYLDVVYEIMLKYGVFDMPLKETIISNKKMFDVGNGHMIICLADQITMEDVTEIAKISPHCVVFKESGFKDDNEKINATYTLERFKVEKILCI